MANIFNADSAILRLAELNGQTYETAKRIFEQGVITFSVPVTDENIQITANVADAPYPRSTDVQDFISIQHQMAGTGNETALTVSAGKDLWIFGITLEHNGAVQLTVFEDDGTTANLVIRLGAAGTLDAGSGSVPMMKYAAGEKVILFTGAANANITFWGFEQDSV